MRRKGHAYASVLFAAWWLCAAMACTPNFEDESMITEDRAVEIASMAFTAQGRRAADYDVSIETYPADENQWIVWFDKKGPFRIPGGKHAVVVHKSTGQSEFMAGE